jgi:XTP/dITP diphosphohydrolase
VSRSKPIVLLLATTNAGKARELRHGLRGAAVRVLTLDDLGIRSEYPETGSTFAANARGKSLHYAALSGLPTLADDSGLGVDALGGAPGVYSARFSDPGATDAKNIRKVLSLMDGVPPGKRGARFVCAMALSYEGRVLKTTHGVVRGRIIGEPRGSSGFGYDPIFFYRPLGRTFGQLSTVEKESISHRGRALEKMIAFLTGLGKEGRPLPGKEGTARGGGSAPGGRSRQRIRRPADPSA